MNTEKPKTIETEKQIDVHIYVVSSSLISPTA